MKISICKLFNIKQDYYYEKSFYTKNSEFIFITDLYVKKSVFTRIQ